MNPTAGDIGPERRWIEAEPLPDHAQPEPTPAPQPDREPVPA